MPEPTLNANSTSALQPSKGEVNQTHLPLRAQRVLWWLAGLTLAGIALVWTFPDESLWHFWLIAQCLPVAYCVLIYRGVHAS